jgi:tetratricopeptide (TPR) repeat protein
VQFGYDWAWEAAEASLARAVELNPSYATAHHWRAHLYWTTRRFEQAMASIRRARELDPLSRIININVSIAEFFARQYEQAERTVRLVLEMEPAFPIAYYYLGLILLRRGAYADALAALQRAQALGRGLDVAVETVAGYAHARLGNRAEAEAILTALERRYHEAYASPVWIAVQCVGMGEVAAAFEWLERAYQDRDGWIRLVGAFPLFDEIRDEPRFVSLAARVGLRAPGSGTG